MDWFDGDLFCYACTDFDYLFCPFYYYCNKSLFSSHATLFSFTGAVVVVVVLVVVITTSLSLFAS